MNFNPFSISTFAIQSPGNKCCLAPHLPGRNSPPCPAWSRGHLHWPWVTRSCRRVLHEQIPEQEQVWALITALCSYFSGPFNVACYLSSKSSCFASINLCFCQIEVLDSCSLFQLLNAESITALNSALSEPGCVRADQSRNERSSFKVLLCETLHIWSFEILIPSLKILLCF